MVKFKQETSGMKPFLWTREEWDDNVDKSMAVSNIIAVSLIVDSCLLVFFLVFC
jgi:hypothetical protein